MMIVRVKVIPKKQKLISKIRKIDDMGRRIELAGNTSKMSESKHEPL